MELSSLDHFFWAAGFAGHIILLAVLFWRKLIARFPVFTGLIAFNILRTIALFCAQRFGLATYYYAYWAMSIVDCLLQFLIFVEMACKLFKPTGDFDGNTRFTLTLTAMCSGCIAALISSAAAPPVELAVQWVVLRINLFSTILMAEAFAALLVFCVVLGYSFNSYVLVIARGLGCYSLLSFVSEGLESFYGPNKIHTFHMLSRVQMGCYLLCLTYWIAGLCVTAPASEKLPSHVEFQLLRFNKYAASTLSSFRLRRGVW